MKKVLALAATALLLAGCTDTSDKNVRLLESMGMTNVQLGGYAWFSCSEDDTFSTGFTATGVNGEQVTGALCGGFFKGTTVRFN